MDSMALARRFAAVLLVASGVACAQVTPQGSNPATLPATSPTALPVTAAAGPAPVPVKRAQVVFTDGKLAVTADNSSLTQILREISRQTGMKIMGTVADDRVFGKYGPAPAADVLAQLLEGTGSNMLLRETAARAPAELILTAREGGPTPPNPNAPPLDDESDVRPEPVPEQAGPPPGAPFRPLGAAVASAVGNTNPQNPPANAPDTQTNNGNGTPAPANATPGSNPTSPNGAQTPQQIFEQLQRMSQQQPANPQ